MEYSKCTRLYWAAKVSDLISSITVCEHDAVVVRGQRKLSLRESSLPGMADTEDVGEGRPLC